jgi:hypothetical protein
MSCREAPNLPVTPGRIDKEVVEPLVRSVCFFGRRAGPNGDRLRRFALLVAQQSEGVDRERALAALVSKLVAHHVEVPAKTPC